ncbi:MAG: PIN domain-containing protein [Alphaproteobacteria bacterium]|nr:PIN domain-containing protein [Alphaproteobacteria bacterium]
MKRAFLFDTNIIRNTGLKSFFGSEHELKKLSTIGKIVIPQTVIMEIKNHRKKHLEGQKKAFFKNELFNIYCLDKTKNDLDVDVDVENKIEILNKRISFEYEVCDVTRNDFLNEAREYAIKNKPPFDQGNDKGFKDAIIYFSILDWIESNNEYSPIVFSQDGRLSQAFKTKNITVIETINECHKFIWNDYNIDHIFQRFKDHESIENGDITKSSVKKALYDSVLNLRNDWEIIIGDHIVILDYLSKEILHILDKIKMKGYINDLSKNNSLSSIHDCIIKLDEYEYFTDEQIEILEKEKENNDKIKSLIDDKYVDDFYFKLGEMKQQK